MSYPNYQGITFELFFWLDYILQLVTFILVVIMFVRMSRMQAKLETLTGATGASAVGHNSKV
jgi:hypothetical protein